MNRAFTISFEFEGKTYLAMASIKNSLENDVYYTIRVYDDVLMRIIPENDLVYTKKKPLCPSSLKHRQALRLFTCISDAVTYHIEASTVGIRQVTASTIR